MTIESIADLMTAISSLIAAGCSLYVLVVARDIRHNTNSIMEARLEEKGEASEAKGVLIGRKEMKTEMKIEQKE